VQFIYNGGVEEERPTGTETKKRMKKRAKRKGGNAREREEKRTESEGGR